MDKFELLRSIGFSDEYLLQLKKHEKNQYPVFNDVKQDPSPMVCWDRRDLVISYANTNSMSSLLINNSKNADA